MTDRFKYSKVRQHIIDDLRMDLIGPADPYEKMIPKKMNKKLILM